MGGEGRGGWPFCLSTPERAFFFSSHRICSGTCLHNNLIKSLLLVLIEGTGCAAMRVGSSIPWMRYGETCACACVRQARVCEARTMRGDEIDAHKLTTNSGIRTKIVHTYSISSTQDVLY